jgi:hypothetical protein
VAVDCLREGDATVLFKLLAEGLKKKVKGLTRDSYLGRKAVIRLFLIFLWSDWNVQEKELQMAIVSAFSWNVS